MRAEAPESGDRLHRRLAGLLGVGTWASCALIAAGMASSAAGAGQAAAGRYLVMAGIALLIGLPTLGVATIGLWFALKRDPAFALVAALVLTIIVASTLLGLGAA